MNAASIAAHPGCPPERRDSLLTWIALGGAGRGDPTFDPDAPRVNPDNANEPLDAFHRRHSSDEWSFPLNHALWPIRWRCLNERRQIEYHEGEQLARDPAVLVRRRAAAFRLSKNVLREMFGDEDVWVGRLAEERLRDPLLKPAKSPRQRLLWMASIIIAPVIIVILNRPDPARTVITEPVGGNGSITFLVGALGYPTGQVPVRINPGSEPISLQRVLVSGPSGSHECAGPASTTIAPFTSMEYNCYVNFANRDGHSIVVEAAVNGETIRVEKSLDDIGWKTPLEAGEAWSEFDDE